jgi:hypothetical protein
MAAATEFKGEGGVLGMGATRGGTHNLGLRPDTIQSLKKAQNRCRSTFLWSHRMIHEASGDGTRTKRRISSSWFQRIQDHLIPTPYEGDIAKTIQGCWLNPRWTWKPSWSRLVTWRWGQFVHVHCGDVLIKWWPKNELYSEVTLYIHYHKVGKDEGSRYSWWSLRNIEP